MPVGSRSLMSEIIRINKSKESEEVKLLAQVTAIIELYSGFSADRLEFLRKVRRRLMSNIQDPIALEAARVNVRRYLNNPGCFKQEAYRKVAE